MVALAQLGKPETHLTLATCLAKCSSRIVTSRAQLPGQALLTGTRLQEKGLD